MEGNGRFANKHAIITGAAKGIGRATVLRLLREGGRATVIEAEREDSEWAKSLKDEAAAIGARLLYLVGDVTNEQQVIAAVERSVTEFGDPDILVNNVGFSMLAAPLDQLSLADWDRTMAVNVTSAFLLSRAVLPHMRKRGGGSIVNMSSIAGTQISENAHLNYHAAKAAIVGLTHKLAFEEGKNGIRVNAVAPGTTLTERVAPRYDLPEDVLKQKMKAIPLGRAARPHEIAAVILFLASDDASYVSGITVNANGGRFMT